MKKVRFAVESDSNVQELGAAPPSEHLFRPDPSEVVVECPTGSESPIEENIPQENMTEGNFVQHISTGVTDLDDSDKVNRCLARYSPRATTTNRPTNRAPNKPAWPGPN